MQVWISTPRQLSQHEAVALQHQLFLHIELDKNVVAIQTLQEAQIQEQEDQVIVVVYTGIAAEGGTGGYECCAVQILRSLDRNTNLQTLLFTTLQYLYSDAVFCVGV